METHDDDVENSSRFLPGIVLLEPVQVFVERGMQWPRQRSTWELAAFLEMFPLLIYLRHF